VYIQNAELDTQLSSIVYGICSLSKM